MNSKIEQSITEFDEGNYENALNLLEDIEVEGREFKLAMMLKYTCLMSLNRYDESLAIINSLIESDPYDVDFWISKAKCHYFSHNKKSAKKAVSEAERLIDESDIRQLVKIAQVSNLIGNKRQALKYCDMALEIDETSLDALREKSLVASSLKDSELMNECADGLIDLCGDDTLLLVLPLLLRLFSGNYAGCLDLLNNADFDDDHVEMVKIGVYNQMCEDLNVQIAMSSPVLMDVGEALELLFKYHYEGVSCGNFKGVLYSVVTEA